MTSSTIKELEKMPFLSITAALVIISLLIYCPTQTGFFEILIPTYVSEAITLVVLDYAVIAPPGNRKNTMLAFFAACLWMFNQFLHWAGLWNTAPKALTAASWLVMFAHIAIAIMFFTETDFSGIPRSHDTSWAYAGLAVLLLFGLGKLAINIALGTPVWWAIWGVSISILTIGYLIQPMDREISTIVKVIGLVMAAMVALMISGSGLRLIP